MRILILGAGVVGVSSAWHLLKDGHDVTVIDRALPAKGGASFGNAGLIAPGHSFACLSQSAEGFAEIVLPSGPGLPHAIPPRPPTA